MPSSSALYFEGCNMWGLERPRRITQTGMIEPKPMFRWPRVDETPALIPEIII